MSEFSTFFNIGLHHVLSFDAFDHILFLVALTATFTFKDWKKVLILVTIFTVGHSLALFLSVFGVVVVKTNLVEFLILVTIILTATYNIFNIKTPSKNGISISDLITLFFGIIHGLGFSNYIKSILSGTSQSKILPLTEFALGIELAQILIVLVALLLSYLFQIVFKLTKRDWILVVSSLIIGVVLPMLFENKIN